MSRTGIDREMRERILRKCRAHWPPISQARLGRRLDIDEASFSRIMTGKQPAPEGMVERIAEIFGCDVTEILSSSEQAA